MPGDGRPEELWVTVEDEVQEVENVFLAPLDRLTWRPVLQQGSSRVILCPTAGTDLTEEATGPENAS